MDPDRLDEIVAAIPTGRWMSYGDVARAAGGTDQHARALNQRFIRVGDAGRAPRAQERRQHRRHRARRPGRGAPPPRVRGARVHGRPRRPGGTPAAGRAEAADRGDGGAEHGSRLSARHNGRVLPRPPLPPGPYLVVGLARSGVAAALALRGARRGGRRLRRRARCRPSGAPSSRRAGVPVHAGVAGARAARRGRRGGQEPRRARRRRRSWPRPARPGVPWSASSSSAGGSSRTRRSR